MDCHLLINFHYKKTDLEVLILISVPISKGKGHLVQTFVMEVNVALGCSQEQDRQTNDHLQGLNDFIFYLVYY